MKVKRYYPEYKDWKTEKQWAKEKLTIADRSKAVELWSNQFCQVASLYAAPDNVRPMTVEELEAEKAKRKKAYAERKIKQERKKQREEYACKLREDWHTPWQWLSEYSRVVNDGAYAKSGKTLNEWIGRNACVFGSDYAYFNIRDTKLITDKDELDRLIQESNKRYYENL